MKFGNLLGTLASYFHIGAGAREASSKLQVDSTTSGFLSPRMTTAQRTGIAAPAEGLEVYDTDLSAKFVYDGGAWVQLPDSSYVDEGDQRLSTGAVTEPTFSDNGDGTANVGSTTVRMYTSADFTGNIQDFVIPADATLGPFTDGDGEWIVAEYNGGTPRYVVEDNHALINDSNRVAVYRVWRQGSELHSLSGDEPALALANKLATQLWATHPYQRAGSTGLVPAETDVPADRTVTVSAAGVYAGFHAITVLPFNSSTDLLTKATVNTGTWSYSNEAVYNNTDYNPAGGPAAMAVNKYGVRWFYRSIGDVKQVFYVLGSEEHNTVAAAEIEAVRTDLPEVIKGHCVLVGRAIIQNGATSGVMYSAWDTTFQGVSVIAHNDTTNIQGGVADQYYHLDATEHSSLTGGANSTEHYHDADRARANHTGTQLAATISDFDATVSANADVAANTTHRTSDGSDHTFIDQDVTSGSSPTLDGTNFSGVDHNSTVAKQGGTANEYYHLTSAEYSTLSTGEGYLPRSAWRGTFVESFDARVTSDGVTITMSLEQSGGGDLTMQFSDGQTTLDCTPAATIALTEGSVPSPQSNYIYIPQSTKVLTKSTTGWPASTVEHIKVAYFFCTTAADTQTDGGPLINQNWNDHLANANGHITHIGQWIRSASAKWFSGCGGGGTSDYITIAAGGGTFQVNAGVISQMHQHSFSAKDTSAGDNAHVWNYPSAAYTHVTNLNEMLLDSAGGSLTNRYYSIVLSGVANKSGEYSPLIITLPGGSYNNSTAAIADTSNYDNYNLPREFTKESSTAFLIARITLRNQSDTTFTVVQTQDLRGQDPFTAAAGGSGGGAALVEFPDNQFKIYDNLDTGKEIQFTLDSLTTGFTRDIVPADADMKILSAANHDTLTDTSDASSLHHHDTDYITKALGTTKGDIIAFTGSGVPVRLGVGTDTQVLTADSAEASGVKWADASGGGASPFDATVGPTLGDYANVRLALAGGKRVLLMVEDTEEDTTFNPPADFYLNVPQDIEWSVADGIEVEFNAEYIAFIEGGGTLSMAHTSANLLFFTYSGAGNDEAIVRLSGLTLRNDSTSTGNDFGDVVFHGDNLYLDMQNNGKVILQGNKPIYSNIIMEGTGSSASYGIFLSSGGIANGVRFKGQMSTSAPIITVGGTSAAAGILSNAHNDLSLGYTVSIVCENESIISNLTGGDSNHKYNIDCTGNDQLFIDNVFFNGGTFNLTAVEDGRFSNLYEIGTTTFTTATKDCVFTNCFFFNNTTVDGDRHYFTNCYFRLDVTEQSNDSTYLGCQLAFVDAGSWEMTITSGSNRCIVVACHAGKTIINQSATAIIQAVTTQTGNTFHGDIVPLQDSPGDDHSVNGFISQHTVDTNSTGLACPLYINSADGNYDEADADAESTMPCVALAVDTGTGAGKRVLNLGYFRDDTWTWTVGGRLWVSTTVGTLTQTAPSGSGDVVQCVGYAVSADVIYFNPNFDYTVVP